MALLLACPRPAPVTTAPSEDALWESPILPSPTAGTYALVPGRPVDPVIAGLVGDIPYDLSLAGAAAGVALATTETGSAAIQKWRVREFLVRAGYPFTIHAASHWETGHQTRAPKGLEEWLERRTDSEHVGVVRARGAKGDHWVALAGRAKMTLNPLPRTLAAGGTLVLPANPGGRWELSAPDGTRTLGSLEQEARLEARAPGEWLLQLEQDGRVAAAIPIYVGVAPPTALLLEPSLPPAHPQEAIQQTVLQLDRIRDAYGLASFAPDPLLDGYATSWIHGDGVASDTLAASLGLRRVIPFRCTGTSVQDCLDSSVWDPEVRQGLLSQDATLAGVAATIDHDLTLHVVLGVPADE